MSQPRLLNLIHQIRDSEPVNPHAIAFMLTEGRFRGPFLRTCEIAWMLLQLSIRRVPVLTIGLCQVEFSYWADMYGFGPWNLVRAILDDVSNYRVCCHYLNIKSCDRLDQAAITYTGRPSWLYVQLLSENLQAVQEAMQRIRERTPEIA